MKTIVIVGGIILAGATMIAVMMDGRNDGSVNSQGIQSQTAPATKPSDGGAAKLNPAHGQPGHRCDLAVGAPLDGGTPPTPVNVIPNNPQSLPQPQPQPQSTSKPGVKLNPAHGQPGHRCDLQVGAPLT